MKSEKDALEWLKINKLPYWRVCFANNSKALLKCEEEEEQAEEETKEISLDKSLNFYSKSIETLPDGQYVIYARKHPKGFNGELTYFFEIKNEPVYNQSIALSGLQNNYANEVYELKLRLLQQENDYKFNLFKLEIENEREKERLRQKAQNTQANVSGLDKFLQIVDSIGNLIAKKESKKSTGEPSQEEPEVNNIDDDEKAQKLQDSLEKLHSIFGDELPEGLETLANFSVNSPEYVKNLLKSMQNVTKN